MKFSVSSKELLNLASNVSKVIGSKNVLAVLNYFLCSVEGNNLTMTGTDVDNSITGKIGIVDSWGDGKFLVESRRLIDLLKELGDQPISIDVNEENYEIKITTSNGQYTMTGLDTSSYPRYKDDADGEDGVCAFTCNAEPVIKGLDRAVFAVGYDVGHPQFSGVFVDIKPENITFVATDTRKMIKYEMSSIKPGIEASFIVPVKAANIIKSIFAKSETIVIDVTSKFGVIIGDTYKFTFSFVKGRYPDYKRIIPKCNPFAMNVNRMELINSIRRVNVFIDSAAGLVKAKITPESIHLKSGDVALLSQGLETVPCQYNGSDMVIGVSAPYLIEVCNSLRSDEIICALDKPDRPLVFTQNVQDDNEDLLILLMPMSVKEY